VPADWGTLRMSLTWRSSRLRVTARLNSAEVAVDAGEPVNLAIGDGPWQRVAAGDTLRAP
jgi:hypothetical protein